MKLKSTLKGLLFTTTTIIGSHVAQVYNIESRCEGIRERAIETLNTPQEDFKEGIAYVRSQVPSEREDYLFIVGDFQTADNKARCGGRAKLLCEYLSERGFDTDIRIEVQGFGLHYYAVCTKDGETFRN